jgi:magnesium transporter
LQHNQGLIRQKGADYLAYAILDAIVDHNLVLLETFDGYVELLEQQLAHANGKGFEEIFQVRNTILQFRRLTNPIRDALHSLMISNSKFIHADTKVYFQDVHDHAVSLAETIQSIREDITSYTELRLALLSHKSNATIHVLTIVSTIFIPLTFLSSIYGMNFDNMPELHHPDGYFVLWGIMALLVVGQLLYFRRKNWF